MVTAKPRVIDASSQYNTTCNLDNLNFKGSLRLGKKYYEANIMNQRTSWLHVQISDSPTAEVMRKYVSFKAGSFVKQWQYRGNLIVIDAVTKYFNSLEGRL